MPFRELGFSGVPFKSTVFVMPSVNCLVELIEMPFLVVTLEDIELVNLERVGFNLKNFDMAIVFKVGHEDCGLGTSNLCYSCCYSSSATTLPASTPFVASAILPLLRLHQLNTASCSNMHVAGLSTRRLAHRRHPIRLAGGCEELAEPRQHKVLRVQNEPHVEAGT